jgi:hypothetical protein
MPLRLDLQKKAAAYQHGNLSLDGFEDWFRNNARGMFGEDEEVLEACLSLDNAFVELRSDTLTEREFCNQLKKIIGSLGSGALPNVSGDMIIRSAIRVLSQTSELLTHHPKTL